MMTRNITIVLMTISAIVSCSKYEISDIRVENPARNEERVISLKFNNSTKTSLDALNPHFNEGDLIKVSNTVASQVCTVKVENGNASITTTLSGNLTAVYPSTAANMNGEEIEGIIVPSRQSGRFEDANICQASIPEGSTSARFQNKVAILKFYVDKCIGVKSIKVESSSSIASDGGKEIIVDPDGNSTINTVTDDPGQRLCYIATIGGIETKNLKFTSETTTQGTVFREFNASFSLLSGAIYKVFIPYYIEIKVKNNPAEYQRWGYCNVGGFLPEDYGDYYGWGAVETIYGKEYDWVNAPFQTVDTYNWGETRWTKYLGSTTSKFKAASAIDEDALKTVLDPEDDIASVKWGGEWRMPTIEDFEIIQANCNREWKDVNGVEGYEITTKYGEGSPLFLPAAGYLDIDFDADGDPSWGVGSDGYYWLSSLDTVNPYQAHYFYFFSGTFAADVLQRYSGQSIRPII